MIAVTRRLAPAPDLRAEYLDLLPEPQELFVENLVVPGTCWAIRRDDREIGYAVIDRDAILVELHVRKSEVRFLAQAFDALVETCGVRRILAKSFDATPLFVAFSRPCQTRTTGMLYRVIADPTFEADARVRARAATRADVESLLRLGADFFDDAAEIEVYILSDGLMIYEARDGATVGAGVLKRVIADRHGRSPRAPPPGTRRLHRLAPQIVLPGERLATDLRLLDRECRVAAGARTGWFRLSSQAGRVLPDVLATATALSA
jgi:hypothetical protein